jgi:hypothetical protein
LKSPQGPGPAPLRILYIFTYFGSSHPRPKHPTRLGIYRVNVADFILRDSTPPQQSNPAVSLRLGNPNFANNYLEYLREFEAIGEPALARESGPERELFYEKNIGSNIL